MKAVVFAYNNIGCEGIEALLKNGFEITAVFTHKDNPAENLWFRSVAELAAEKGIPVYAPEDPNHPLWRERIRAMKPDYLFSFYYRQLLGKEILSLPSKGALNLHGSLLPKYRGAAPIQWAIIEGESVTGVTTMQMDEGLDTGDMIMKTEIPIAADETGETLHDKLAAAGAELCVKTLKALEEGTAVHEKQGESPTAYAKMLTKELGNIDWAQPAVKIERLIRGLNSWPGTYSHWNGKVMKIWKAKVEGTSGGNSKPGTVLTVGKNDFTVQTGNGTLRIMEVQMPGKKRMETGAFLRGNAMEPGDLLVQE